jgi:hypothetical protein
MDEYAAGPVEAPPAPTPVDENNPSEAILQLGSDSVGSPSEKMAATTGSGTAKAPALPNKDLSTSQAKTGEDGPVVGDQTAAGQNASASKPEDSSKGDKGASTSIYAIPDPVDEDKNPPSKPAGAENKIAKTGAVLDPIQDVNETKEETKAKGEKSQDASRASWVVPPDESNQDKNSEAVKNSPTKIDDTTTTVATDGGDGKNTVDTGSLGTNNKSKETKSTPVQEPPPIPKGLHDPFHSLPEAPANPTSTAKGSPRDANARKTTVNPTGVVAGNPKASGPDRGITGITVSPANAEAKASSGTIATNQVATDSAQSRSLTPGVMPSPRTLSLAPAGDTAPEPNVRLGPPAGNPPANPAGQQPSTSTTNPASALPPSNQVAQGPTPSLPGPGASPQVAQGPASSLPGPGVGTPYQAPGFTPSSNNPPVRTPSTQVDSYDEETYLCKQGDTFAGICAKFYQSEKYSQALLLFNRNHPRATAGVRQDPPSLAPGQPVYIPPLRVLEKRYPAAMSDRGLTDQPANPSSATPEAGSSTLPPAPKEIPGGGGPTNYAIPDAKNPASAIPDIKNPAPALPDTKNPAPALPTPGVNPVKSPPPRGEHTYVVPKSGQTFWEISRQTLGNPNRWSEIYRLNDKIDPKYPVPGDTVLRMPADARLDLPSPTTERVN